MSVSSPACLHVYQSAARQHRAQHRAQHPAVLVLLPGLGGNGLSFPASFVLALSACMHAVIAVTYPTPPATRAAHVAADVWHALGAILGPECPLVLAGYSMGGFIVQEMLAARHEHGQYPVVGAVLLSTAIPQVGAIPVPVPELLASVGRSQTSPLRGLFPSTWIASLTAPQIRALTKLVAEGRLPRRVRNAQLHVVADFLLHPRPDSSAVDGDTDVPLLCLHGALDTVLTLAAMEQAVQKRPLNKTLVVFPDAGHGLLFQHEAAVVDTIAQWAGTVAMADHGPPDLFFRAAPHATVVWSLLE